MSDPVHELLAEAVKGWTLGEHALQRVWDDLYGQTRHPHYDDTSNPKEPPVSLLSDVETWIADAGRHVPVIHDAAVKLDQYANSKIVAELEALAQPLDPAVEELAAGLIRTAGAAAAKLAELTAPPAEAAPAAAEVPAGDPTPQTYVAQ